MEPEYEASIGSFFLSFACPVSETTPADSIFINELFSRLNRKAHLADGGVLIPSALYKFFG